MYFELPNHSHRHYAFIIVSSFYSHFSCCFKFYSLVHPHSICGLCNFVYVKLLILITAVLSTVNAVNRLFHWK